MSELPGQSVRQTVTGAARRQCILWTNATKGIAEAVCSNTCFSTNSQ
jgi:hypothetical protein